MKNIFTVLASTFFLLLFCANILSAQTIVNVTPSIPDALFNAVSAAQAGDVLVLASGGVYPIANTLPVTASNLTIKTADNYTAKAKVVYVANSANAYPASAISCGVTLNIKNVIFDMQQGSVRAYGDRFINRSAAVGTKILLDGVEVYHYNFLSTSGQLDTLIVQNCYFLGGVTTGGGWGGTFDFQGNKANYVKIQNNTFAFNVFAAFLGSGWRNIQTAANTIDSLIIDHNTMINTSGEHGPTIMCSRVKNIKITNNLFVNPTFRPNEWFSDKYLDFRNNDDTSSYVKNLGPKGMWVFSINQVDSAGTKIDMHANNIYWTPDVLAKWTAVGLGKPYMYHNEMKSVILDTTKSYFAENVTFTNGLATPMMCVNAVADSCVKYNANPTLYAKKTPFAGFSWYNGVTANYDFKYKANADLSYNTTSTSYTAGDRGLPLGDLNWFPAKKVIWLDVKEIASLPTEFGLSQNYPNPFNPTTNINFSIKQSGFVTLKVFNILGQEVATLVNKNMQPGSYNVDFNASKLSSGVYIYKLTAGTFTSIKKMMLTK